MSDQSVIQSSLETGGVEALSPPKVIIARRAPSSTNRADTNQKDGTIFIDQANGVVYIKVETANAQGTWVTSPGGAGTFTSVTSPIYTAPAATDMNINASTGQDIIAQMGDAAGANKISFEDSASVEVASLDSDGAAIFTSVTSPTYTSAAGADTNYVAAAGQDAIVKMGDAAGANKVSYTDSADVEVASLDSDGNATFTSVISNTFTAKAASDLNVVAIAGQDVIVKMGDAAGANKVSFTDSADAESASLDSDGTFTSDGDMITTRSDAAAEVTHQVTNSDNTSALSDAFFEAAVGGTSSGNPGMRFQISGGQNYAMGIDNASAADDLLICGDNDIGTDPLVRIEEAGDVSVEKGNLKLVAAAKQLQVEGGAVTDFIGQATLTAGTVTVANTNIAATDRIFVTRSDLNGSTALGLFDVSITAATSFVIDARKPADATVETSDVSIVDYFIVRQL